jgi:GNAT superfamily N-acetyltransferase
MGHATRMILIRRIRSADFALARAVRLRALSSDPLSFGSSYAAEVTRDETFWRESARRHAESDQCAIFIAFRGDEPVGLVRGGRDESREGMFFIHAMWVAPEVRRSGVAQKLMATVEQWIAEHGGTTCELMVTDAAPAARRLYEACGYVPDGHTEPSPHAGIQEHRMRKVLPKRDGARHD